MSVSTGPARTAWTLTPRAARSARNDCDSEKDAASSPRAIESRVVGGATSLALEKELGGVHRSSESSEDDVVLLKDETDAQGYREGQRRKGVLRKLHLHKI